MRITVSSPDGLGDFVLRMPLFQALLEAGNELQILTLSPATEFARIMLPGALITSISRHPYSREARETWRPFTKDFSRIAEFRPDFYVVGLFQPSFFDEVWTQQGDPRIPVAGLVSNEEFWPSETTVPASELAGRYTVKAAVDNDLPEIDKNRRLASAILGRNVEKKPLRLAPPDASVPTADGLLARHGLREGGFHVVCAGTRRGLEMKDWGEKNWQCLLAHLVRESGCRLVFLGNREESPSVDRILSALPSGGHVNLAAELPDIGTTFHVIARSAGYVGRDSGLMHLAAAAGIPVLAAFGGGHWGRFLPQDTRSVVVTLAMPCQRCNWRCHYSEPHCIRRISVEQMIAGWDALRSPSDGNTVMEFAPPDDLLPQIGDCDPAASRKALHAARRNTLRGERARGPVDALRKKLGKLAIRPKRGS